MFSQGSPQGHRSHLRFYVFMVTLVLGGLFFLLYSNENHDNTSSLISAIVGYSENMTQELDSEATEPDIKQELNQLIGEGNKVKNYRSIPLSLSFDQIPTLEKNATVERVDLEFDDLSTTITVNGDKLELKNLKEVTLSIQDFIGRLNLETSELSLSGTATRIEVNNIAFSSEKALPISFQGLNYKHLQLLNIELKDLGLPRGEGELRVGKKLRYTLEDEELKMLYFKGTLTVDKKHSNNSMLLMEGDVKGLYDTGDLLTLVLQ
ncbi:MAG: hypothetical protein Q8R47_06045 [Nanoarchaeota archaeon]|nr:hypothetical protein [Nanoarchaeota archaeon]